MRVKKGKNMMWCAGLSLAVMGWLTAPVLAADEAIVTRDIVVEENRALEEAKLESQQTTIITQSDIAKKQAKSVEDIIFSETGVSRTVDAMGRVTVSIRGAEPRHTLILIDGQPVMGDFAKYSEAGDELQRLGTENVDHIEIIQGAASAKYGPDAIGGVINVVTRKAAKIPGMQVNIEGRRARQDGDIFPYQNFFLRADSGQIGKFRAAVYGSKREIMPIYSTQTFGGVINSGSVDNTAKEGSHIRNSLRYYGNIKNIGLSTSYDIDDKNKIDFNIDKTEEDMERYVKHSNSSAEPQQHFKRELDRNTYRLSYTGNNGGSTDWKIDVDYAKMTENDITLTSNYNNSKYEGKNTLNYIDDIMHKQWNMKASANTQINDKHLITYGFGYTKETGEGSRLKNAPNTTARYIDPWDYDKNLYTKAGKGEPASNVIDHAMSINKAGIPYFDQNYEWYGIKNADGQSITPVFTYQDFIKYGAYGTGAPQEVIDRINEFGEQLKAENPQLTLSASSAVNHYYGAFGNDGTTWNGRTFKEEYALRHNRQQVGRAEIKKQNFYIQDTWQINQNTILTPIFRIDHSDVFGSNATFNMGLTHYIGGHTNRRFKANIGTGYTEPGMGELYYNWEMYAGMPVDIGIGKLGYYWVGNPDLKPEKSVNFDIGIEGENENTSTRLNIFHNKIKNYMTTYFTGYLMDFYPDETDWKWVSPPDMIYSFKNIGKAEITGVEAEIIHQFDEHWSGKLGYTYLYAINKSDSTMPRQLLDKPQHKVDIGISYENIKKGWRASLWGDYYIHMLDSNSVANNGNYLTYDSAGNVQYNFAEGGKQNYTKKTFGLWNILFQKKINKDSIIYAGIDNLFNHKDDDQAFQERVYKAGLNMKFGSHGRAAVKNDKSTAASNKAEKNHLAEGKVAGNQPRNKWFVTAPFDTEKEKNVEFIGNYRARWNSFAGKIKPSEARITTTASVGTAYKNYLEKANHGFEQRIQAGIDARIGSNTNLTLLGSASGMSGVDTRYDVSDSKGINQQRMDTIDITQHAKKWDFSMGRLAECMGVTAYWFGKEYDGARAVWTSGKNQVRFGYGDFSQSTGITDSAYTHATRQVFMRAPTKEEWLGKDGSLNYPWDRVYSDMVVSTKKFDGLYQKLAKVNTLEEQKQIIDQYLEIVKQNDPNAYNTIMLLGHKSTSNKYQINAFVWKKITLTNEAGEKMGEYLAIENDSKLKTNAIPYEDMFDKEKLELAAETAWEKAESSFEESKTYTKTLSGGSGSFLVSQGKYTIASEFYGYGTYTGKEVLEELGGYYAVSMDKVQSGDFENITKEEAKEKAITSLWNKDNALKSVYSWYRTSPNSGVGNIGMVSADIAPVVNTIVSYLAKSWKPEDDSKLPLHILEELGIVIPQIGTVLVQDQIAPLNRAAFVQVKHQFGDTVGVQAWYLRSVDDDTHAIAYADGDHNDAAFFDQLANVIGLGAAWRIGDNIRFSYDWGQSRTDFGRFMNGSTLYTHEAGTSDFSINGRANGGTPRFWVARVDIGKSDTDKPGSWNAFADYKYFQHGSFFGGNGTEGVPDRYLDGIKSFTVGGGYVPAKDLLLEAFYTFDAKGIGRRDTLYGSENFTLGDYVRVQVTHRF